MTKPRSICFVSRYAHHVLLGETDLKIGGAEFQQAVIGRALADRGWRVNFITEGSRGENPLRNGLIRIFAGMDYSRGPRLLRRPALLPLRLWGLMARVDAQVYYQRNPGAFSFVIALFCRIRRRRFVLAGANDANFDPRFRLNVNSPLDELEVHCGIRLAHTVIVQTRQQLHLLRRHRHRDGRVFGNIYCPPDHARPVIRPSERPRLLWVGRIAAQKRPEFCLKLARSLREFDLVMVGATTHQSALAERIGAGVGVIPNLYYLGHLSISQVENLFDNAHGLVNTSLVEGFPNTFLQAWSRGMPVFSMVDPDEFIARFGLGAHRETVSELTTAIRSFFSADYSGNRTEAIRTFFFQRFSVECRIPLLEKILLGGHES